MTIKELLSQVEKPTKQLDEKLAAEHKQKLIDQHNEEITKSAKEFVEKMSAVLTQTKGGDENGNSNN